MAVRTITYGDKQFLNENVDIPATNKVKDSDMNEIKSVVNNNANELSNIIESGSNENGNYIKYADGTMICYKSVTASVNFSTNWGGLYEGTITLGDWSQPFTTLLNVQTSNASGAGALIESYDPMPTTTSAGGIYLVRPTTYTTTVTMNVLAIGTWK